LYTRLGITLAVYGDESGTERSIPFDIIPHIIRPNAWKIISDGACQRVRALNAFLKDVYNDREILEAGIIPAAQVTGDSAFRPELQGMRVPGNVYVHIAGVDIVKTGPGEFCWCPTWLTPEADATTAAFRSTPTRPKQGALRASGTMDTRRAPCLSRLNRRILHFR
jgi:uncharacterized circularly permuted ATP-grasp superfamily protein